MRLNCEVELGNRLLPSLNIRGKNRSCRGVLSICKKPKKDSTYLLLSTAQNVNGNKYKIEKNIEQIFAKFVSEGKATLRIIEPANDIIIKNADPVLLKSFLSVLSAASKGLSLPRAHVSHPPTQIDLPKDRLVVTKRSSYPSKFPSHLNHLELKGIDLLRVPKAVLKLVQLKLLDLSHNSLEELSLIDFKNMKNLLALSLANNKLSQIKTENNFVTPLKTLDLSQNILEQLPDGLSTNLQSIVTLNVSNNKLKKLPKDFCKLKQLRHFRAANNQIKVLPCGMTCLTLESIDLYDNPLDQILSYENPSLNDRKIVYSLLKLTAASIVAQNIKYNIEDLPIHLLELLKECNFCNCSRPVFSLQNPIVLTIKSRQLAITVTLDKEYVPAELFPCSVRCLKDFSKRL